MYFQEEANRIFLEDDKGTLLAEVTFPERQKNVVEIDHTFVSETLRGQGVASELLDAVAKKVRREGKKIIPICSYAVKWFEKNPQYADLIV